MKKILCFLLAVLMILSVVACDTTKDPVDSDNVSDSTEASDTVDTTEKVNTNVIPAEKYDGVFKVGYARDVITPELPAPLDGLDGLMMTKLKDDLYATCVAVNDGENTALIYTVDLKNIGPVVYSQIQLRVSIATKVPKENIIVSATHNHSAFTPVDNISKSPSESLTKWTSNLPIMLANIAKDAIADMDDAEIYVGSAKTTGMAFIRRYVHEDGSYSGTWTGKHLTSSTKVVGMVADLDDTVQIIRFVRKEKKDVIMANWQAHLASARNVIPGSVTADMAYYIRDNVEKKDDDALVAFFAGASGNVNLTPPSESMRKYANYSMVGRALGDLIVKTALIENLTKLEAGKINGISVNYDAEARKETADRIAKAKEVAALEAGSDEQLALMKKYGFESKYSYNGIISSSEVTVKTYKLYLGSISFGDLAFIGVPYEMFDNNGVQIKEGSPFNTTFILTAAGGYWGYIPSIEYFTEYGGYEVDATQFAQGTGEKLVDEYLKLLKQHKGIS